VDVLEKLPPCAKLQAVVLWGYGILDERQQKKLLALTIMIRLWVET
jgi:hypothetical protein